MKNTNAKTLKILIILFHTFGIISTIILIAPLVLVKEYIFAFFVAFLPAVFFLLAEKYKNELIKQGYGELKSSSDKQIKLNAILLMILSGFFFIVLTVPLFLVKEYATGFVLFFVSVYIFNLSVKYIRELKKTSENNDIITEPSEENMPVSSKEIVENEVIRKDENKSFSKKTPKDYLLLHNDYVVIDLETTGLSPYMNEIIEIAAVKVVNDEIVDTFSSFIKPLATVSSKITELTGISTDMLLSAPRIKDILPEIVKFIGNSVILGHNVIFDMSFLHNDMMEYLNKPLKNECIDTLSLSKYLYPNDSHKLEDLKKKLNVETDTVHRALDDAIATMKCYIEMKKYIKENNIPFSICFLSESPDLIYKKKIIHNVNVSNLVSQNTNFDKSSPVYDKIFVFTGVLQHFSRTEAMQKVIDLGGFVKNTITLKTNFLVLGDNNDNHLVKNGISAKQKKAEELKANGYDIKIISETEFQILIGAENEATI